MVIFTSDNGGYLTYGRDFKNISSNGPFRGQKMQLYEGGHRVPMIVSWPDRIPPGITDEITHSNDLLPTILSLCGADRVESDGINLAPLLMERKSLPKRDLFWRTMSHRAIRSGPWKLVIPRRENAKPELYKLDNDPGEEHNVAKENPAILKKLIAALSQWEIDVNLTAKKHSR